MEVDMEVNNVTQSDHTEPSEEAETEAVEETETAENIKPAELLQPTQVPLKSKKTQKKRGRGRPKKRVFLGIPKKKSVDRDRSPTEQIERIEPTEPPEKWSACRLRRLARESFRKKVAALAEEEKLFRLELKREARIRSQIAKAKRHEERLLQQEALTKLSSVKVKEELQLYTDVQVKVEPEIDIGPDEVPSPPLEREKLSCKKRQKRRETKRDKFPNLPRNKKERKASRMRPAPATQRKKQLLQQDDSAKLNLVELNMEHNFATNVKVEREVDLGLNEERSQPLDLEKLTSKKRRERIETKREKLRGIQRNKRQTKKRRTETEEEKSFRLERLRIATAMRHASETEIGKLLRLERCRMAKLIRLAKETEEEKSLRLEQSDKLRRDRQIAKEKRKETDTQRYRRLQYSNTRKEKLRNETKDERSSRLERERIVRETRRANETEEQRFVRLEIQRMSRLKRLVTETEEEKAIRIEKQKRVAQRRKLKLESLRVARIQQLLSDQMELPNFVVEMIEEDHKAVTGDDFEIDKFTPKVFLHEEASIESQSPKKSHITPRCTPIKKATNSDVVSNLLHSIYGKSHSQQHNRLQRFGNLCTSGSSNHILSTIVWRKLNSPSDDGIDENLIEPVE